MIDDNFKISGKSGVLVDLNDLLTDQPKNDNVQGFDTERDEVLLSMSKVLGEDKRK